MSRSPRMRRVLCPMVVIVMEASVAVSAGEGAAAPSAPSAAAPAAVTAAGLPAASAFERMKGLVGEWIDVDGTFGLKDQVAVSYRLTGSGTTLVETMFVGSPHEMMTMYSRDGGDLVLTHHCSGGNQPRMRARTITGDRLRFEFDGGSNLDPAKDAHMHSAWLEFVSTDEIRGQWSGWAGGKPSDHTVTVHLRRNPA